MITKVCPTVGELRRHINWSFFFAGWGVPGRYPDIFADPRKGEVARSIYADACAMLNVMAAEEAYTPMGLVGDFAARAEGHDIVITLDDGAERRLPMLHNEATGECTCRFLTPSAGSVRLFALCAGIGLETLAQRFDPDDGYSRIMAKLLADRLAEAMADKYLPGGCRMAIGYPAIPDHSLKRDVLDILGCTPATGMSLTENFMIVPAEAVCGLWFPTGRFFDIGTISAAQLADYAARRGIDTETLRHLMPLNTDSL